MFTIVYTDTKERFVLDRNTMNLYSSNGEYITHGYLRFMAVMFRKGVAAFEKLDWYGNCVYSWCDKNTRKALA